MPFTWTELLDDIKTRGAIPTSQSTYTEARLLSLTNAVMRSKVLPVVTKVRESYYSYDSDNTIVSGQLIRIPTRAIGGKLENVCFINGTERQNAARYYEEELTDMIQAPGLAPGFYLKRQSVGVVPGDGGGWGTLRLTMLMRPNQIVAQSDAAQITSIVGKVLTCTEVPSAWVVTNTFDLVQQNPQFDWLGIDLAITAVTTGLLGTVTLTNNPPSDLAVGDWIGLAGQTPVIQCPVELNPYLAQEVANVCLKAQGDKNAYELGMEEAKLIREGVLALINPRVEQEGKKLSNRTGILRRRM